MGDGLRAELDRMVSSIVESSSAREIGFYLHGSQWSGSAGPQSDVDVLALVAGELSDNELRDLRALARDAVEASDYALDLKIHRLCAFGRDQYIDLHSASEFVGGVDVRDRLPERTFDDACHEQVSIACQILKGGTSSEHAGWRRYAKDLAYLASALLAARHGYAARGARDALRSLTELERELGAAVQASIAAQQEDGDLFAEIAGRTRDALARPTAELGPRCRATIEAAGRFNE